MHTHCTYRTSLQDSLDHPKRRRLLPRFESTCTGLWPTVCKAHSTRPLAPAQQHCTGVEERTLPDQMSNPVHYARGEGGLNAFQPSKTSSGIYCLQLHLLSHPGSRGAPVMRQIPHTLQKARILLQGKP